MTSTVSSLTPSSQLQITGLASGLDTNSIVSQMMAVNSRPLTNLQNELSGDKARNSALSSIQSALQGLVTSAQALSSATLFQSSQTATSTNAGVVAASTTSNVGAVVGGYQVAVSQMATAGQQTFNFTGKSGANVVTVNHTVTDANGNPTNTTSTYNLADGASAQDLVDQVNADSSGTVWGTVVDGNVVFSDRTTGSNSTFTVGDGTGELGSGPVSQSAGHDAQLTVNGTPTTSHSNTVTGAIPGVSLTLGGITGTGSPVTVNVGAPAVSTDGITKAVQGFITHYNSVIQTVSGQLSTAPSTSDPTVGTLYQDPELRDLLTNMRQAMYTSGSGLVPGFASMLDLGVSTGSATGNASPDQNNVQGQLSLDTTALTKAITSNPGGVTALLRSWSASFANTVNAVADAGGTISSRMTGNQAQISNLNNQISIMQASLADQQNQLTRTFANLEAALSKNQSTASWLTSQLAALPAAGA